MLDFAKKLISHLPYEIIVILGIVGLAITGVTVASNRITKNLTNNIAQASPSPSPVENPSPSPTLTPSPISAIKPSTASVVTYTDPQPVPTPVSPQSTKIDSATHIELCKTKAETFKTQTETALVLVYNQQNPEVVELANASTIYETNIVAIKYGKVNEGDLEANFTLISNYLKNLHDWAVKQIADYMAIVEGKGNLAYNDHYIQCLNQ